MDAFLSIKQVCHYTSLSRTTIYRKMAEGIFPSPHQLGANRVGWSAQAVENWIEGTKAKKLLRAVNLTRNNGETE